VARGIGRAGEFLREMHGDALQIFHDRQRILKNSVIQPLQNIAAPRAAGGKRDAVGVVDVAAAEGFG